MPLDKKLLFLDIRDERIDVSTYFATFIEFKLSQTAMTGNVNN